MEQKNSEFCCWLDKAVGPCRCVTCSCLSEREIIKHRVQCWWLEETNEFGFGEQSYIKKNFFDSDMRLVDKGLNDCIILSRMVLPGDSSSASASLVPFQARKNIQGPKPGRRYA